MENNLQDLDARLKQITTVVLAAIYTTITDLAPESITVLPNVEISSEGFGLLILGTGAMIFGKGIGASSAGLGVLFDEFKVVLDGSPLPSVNLGLIFSTVTLAFSTWLTGFLENSRVGDFIPEEFGQLKSRQEITKLVRKTLVSIVGLSLANNLVYAYGSQLIENAPIGTATPLFLEGFLRDAILLAIGLPAVLLGFDMIEVYNTKKAQILEELNKRIVYKIEVMKSAEIINVELPETSLVQGKWTPIVVEIMNPTKRKIAYSIEAVFSTKFTPHMDKTPALDPGKGWRQTFFVLPRKQDKVIGRIRFTESKPPKFKYSDPNETIIEIEGKTRNPSGFTAALVGLSGMNFGVLGLSVIWEQILEYVSNPNLLLRQIEETIGVIGDVIIAEIVLFMALISAQVVNLQRKKEEYSTKISFSNDLDDQIIEEIAQKGIRIFLAKYGDVATTIFRGLIGLSTIAIIGFFGREAFNSATQPNYDITSNNEFALIGAGAIAIWVVGFRGLQIMNELTKKTTVGARTDENFILDFKPLGDIQFDKPVEVIVRVRNISEYPGIRIKFESESTIAPPIVESHIRSGEIAQFKIVMTVDQGDSREVLALAYPLFDAKERYLPFEETEPIAKQEIFFEATAQSALGVSKQQEQRLKGIGVIVTGFTGVIAVFGEILQIGSAVDFIVDNAPTILGLQVPFLAAYYRISSFIKNRKSSPGGIEI